MQHYVINKLRLTCPGCGAVSEFDAEALPGPYKAAPKLLAALTALVEWADPTRENVRCQCGAWPAEPHAQDCVTALAREAVREAKA